MTKPEGAIRTVVTGVTGRMGQTLARIVHEDPAMVLVGGTERKGSAAIGVDVGTLHIDPAN